VIVDLFRKFLKVGTFLNWVRTYRNWPVALRLSLFGSNRMSTIRTRDGLQVLIRPDTNDFGIFNAVCASRMYSPAGFEIQPHFTILDIGANIGSFSLCAGHILRQGRGQLFAFEPFPDNYHHLVQNVHLNALEGRVITSDRAVWGSIGKIQLHISEDREPDGFQAVTNTGKHSGVSELAKPGAKTMEVPTTTLDEIVRGNNLAKIDLLKLDCEGAEYQILFNASETTLHRIERITMEVHPTRSFGRGDIEKFLTIHGFSVSGEGEYLYAVNGSRPQTGGTAVRFLQG
jgi:FkbM family methyltransferase